MQKNYSFILFMIEVSEFELQFVFYQIRKLLFLRDSKWQRLRTSILNYNFHVSRVKFAISEIVIILTYMCYVMVKLHREQIHGPKRVCEICPLMALLCLNNSHRRNGILLKMKSKNKLTALWGQNYNKILLSSETYIHICYICLCFHVLHISINL